MALGQVGWLVGSFGLESISRSSSNGPGSQNLPLIPLEPGQSSLMGRHDRQLLRGAGDLGGIAPRAMNRVSHIRTVTRRLAILKGLIRDQDYIAAE